jgi:NADPH:quinone reductase-like Zn-dependent oxidoreductase
MKKIIYNQYGSVDVLHSVEVNKPVPDAQQILVKVKAFLLILSTGRF